MEGRTLEMHTRFRHVSGQSLKLRPCVPLKGRSLCASGAETRTVLALAAFQLLKSSMGLQMLGSIQRGLGKLLTYGR